MVPIVDAQNVAKGFGGRLLWDGITLTIDAHTRAGLIGANGAGKSTLLRIIAGLEQPDAGTITKRKGLRSAYLPQEVAGDERGVLQTVLATRTDVAELEAQLAAIEADLAAWATAHDTERMSMLLDQQGKLLEHWEERGGPRIHNQAMGYLRTLGIDEADWVMPTKLLSGGQRKLVALAGCLLQDPQLLLLDEPDTHLDLQHKAQLEALIRTFNGAVVMVSHDRYLLDETVRTIIEIEDGRLHVWDGNYSAYAVAKELALLRQQELFVAQQKEIARLEAAIARFKLWASIVVDERHIKQARNKQRQIDRMDKVERPVLERKQMGLDLQAAQRGGQKVIELRDVGVAFGDDLILLGLNHVFGRGERVGIVGPNGAGKTVLGRLLVGDLQPTYGEVRCGPSIRTGYYAQSHETLDRNVTLLETVRAAAPMREEQAVSFLGKFLFPYRVVQQKVGALSGGERSRLQLALLTLGGANCLVLDEPTNYLDIASAEVLEQTLAAYTGTLIVISHDRYFLDRVVDQIVALRDGGIRCYGGGYSAYARLKVEG